MDTVRKCGILPLAAFAVAVAACSSSSSGAGGATGSGECNATDPQGAFVPLVVSSGMPPTSMGGTLVDGTYELTSTRYYTLSFADGSMLSPNQRVTLVVSGASIVARSIDDENNVESTGGSFATSGTTFSFTPSCGEDGIGNALVKTSAATSTAYTFDGTNLTLVMTGPIPQKVIEAVYAKK